MGRPDDGAEVVERLLRALNEHDIDGMVACFAEDYVNETPVHPARGFSGSEQVRRNWTQIFAGVPDAQARLARTTVDGDNAWTEWEMSGTRVDGIPFLMRGVVIFRIADDAIASARFYLEPVEETSGDVDVHTLRVAGQTDAVDHAARAGMAS
ncbi:MAG: nuclear transport factor 2 family protein [Geodermatophilaceae bacterium]|nr:nuclear transport factor 2 family protein [Geodermatophilaceae bacterium]MDQ3475771.1 nuclear transport factor 2 family protein [Actinomycetota bacterium]